MKTKSNITRILCYGDSNTWGRSGKNTDRYPASVRWTGILQSMLGERFEIIEEGLRSRTTNLDDADPLFPGRNGKEYLQPCLESQCPTDIVILWLGTNDFKAKFNRNASDIATATGELIEVISQRGLNSNHTSPKVLLISSPFIIENILGDTSQFLGAEEKSKKLAKNLKKVAQDTDSLFIDLAEHVQAGDADGVHLEPEMHPIVAEVIFNKLKDNFNYEE